MYVVVRARFGFASLRAPTIYVRTYIEMLAAYWLEVVGVLLAMASKSVYRMYGL